MGEFKHRLERVDVDTSEPVRLAIAERIARLEEQRESLSGMQRCSECELVHKHPGGRGKKPRRPPAVYTDPENWGAGRLDCADCRANVHRSPSGMDLASA